MRKTAALGAVLAASAALPGAANAAPEAGAAYGDHMVLQRGEPIVIEGTSTPGEEVTGVLGEESASARADAEGIFRLTFATREASSDPLTLTLSDTSGQSTLSDLLIGDVWLCSGQSNMELSVGRALNTWNELRMSADDEMRLLMVPKVTAAAPQREFAEDVEWKLAAPETVEPFSAACFFMAKKLRADLDVPMGLIHSNWGGSAARAWFTPDGVRAQFGEEAIAQLQLYDEDPFAAAQAFVPQWYDWWREGDNGNEPWVNPEMLQWQPIPKFSFWNQWEGTGLDTAPEANVWFRQTFTLSAEQAASDGTVSIGSIDDIDLTWVNGNPVGYTFGWSVERTYHVPAEYLVEGENTVLIAASNDWDTGGFFGTSDRLFFTTGSGDTVPLPADWEYSVGAISTMPPRAPWDSIAGLGVMHNYMIAPIGPMRLAGVAWYQGEADVGPDGYDQKLATLFEGWRGQFGDQARMLVVQLADYGQRVSQPVASGWADLREEQRLAVEADGNAALVTAIDIGEPSDIHPANKNVLGIRLAMAAMDQPLPMPDRAALQAEVITVTFSGVEGGLRAYGGPYPLGVELCGETQESCRYVLASANGNTLRIAADGQPATRVRHGWADAPVVNLYDGRDVAVPGFELEIE